MYFSAISNNELKQFHHTVQNNFSLTLTEALTSDLFKIETIITDNLYKIYPLFYCEKITSSNPDDKIFENKCIICLKNTDTILNFETMVSPNENVELRWCFSANIDALIFYVYDGKTGLPIENVFVEAKTNSETLKGFTRENGIFYQRKTTNEWLWSSCKLMYNDTTINLNIN